MDLFPIKFTYNNLLGAIIFGILGLALNIVFWCVITGTIAFSIRYGWNYHWHGF